MDSEVALLYHEDPDTSELNVMKIAEFLGGAIKPVQLTREVLAHEGSLKRMVSGNGCLITSAQALCKASDQRHAGLGWRQLLMSSAPNVLVYGFEPTRSHSQVLRELTSDSFSGVESLRPGLSEFRVEQDSRQICRQFAGLTFGGADPDKDFIFVEGTKQSQYSPLIRIGDGPFFVSAKDQSGRLMLLAGRQIADLDATVPSNASILQFFSGLAPLMMFLFSASPNGFWHGDTPTACFIVDDPLLKKRYGFLDYRKLLDVMERKRFSTSIAFIPWNYRRSNRRVTELLADHLLRYSLCVHGCDHTAREFGLTNQPLLEEKAQKALDRMALHQRLSGLPFDDIMVFPQGVFSTVAMKALKSCGYLAAVNSTPYPVDVEDSLTLDILDAAVTRFSNFPVFVRRYPRNVAEYAFDLFLGKPALLVEHHGYFRDGYDALAEIVKKVNGLDERLEWTSLANTCSHACLKRTAENGDIHVRFYTDTFRLQNATDRSQNYMLFRRRFPGEPLARVAIDGRPTGCSQDGDFVRIGLSLDAGNTVEVRLKQDRLDSTVPSWHQGPMDRARVSIRRRLCELRDNYVHRSRLLRSMVSIARNTLSK